MALFWDDKDGQGKLLTDGRVCLVIKPDDPNLPEIRTYGANKEQVLEKVARTAETAQAEIHRLRSASARNPSVAAAPAAASPALTADQQAQATADLQNPAKAPQAIKTLLRGAGVDLDASVVREKANRMALIAQEWEREHPDAIWKDPRNQRLLIDTAVLHFGFRQTITAEVLDKAHDYLLQHDMLFPVPAAETVHPDGNPESRTVRNATSYRANALRTPVPTVVTSKPKYSRAEVDAMNTRVLREKIENEPGFAELVNQYATTPIRRSA